MSRSLKHKTEGSVSFANPLDDDDGPESPRTSEPSTPRSLSSLKPSQDAGRDGLVMPGMSLEDMFMAVDPDGSGVVDAEELSEFARLIGVSLNPEQAEKLLAVKGNSAVFDVGDSREFGLKLDRFEELLAPALLEWQNISFDAEHRAAAVAEKVGRNTMLEPMALGCLKLDNPIRAMVITLVHLPKFDAFILLLIILNAWQMALEDPLRREGDEETDFDRWMNQAELGFNLCFTVEMALKIVALGLYKGSNTYLQSPWNVLDAVVVTTAWLPLILPDGTGSSAALRTFRLLRPLRTINRFPGLKKLVTTILLSIPQMQVLVVMLLIYLFTFACVAVQLWQGIMLQRCHVSTSAEFQCPSGEEALCALRENELMAGDDSAFCDMGSSGKGLPWEGRSCPAGDTCEIHHTNPYHGVLSFDNLLSAFIPVLQMGTVCAWQEVMHITQNTSGYFATIYFVFGTVFGGYFLYNLFVAVLKSKLQIVAAVTDHGESVFNDIDTDGSGDISIEELGLIFSSKGVFLSEEELGLLFERVDLDGNGFIDLEEFTTWLRGDDILAVQMRERMDVGSRDYSQGRFHQKNLSIIDLIRGKFHKLEPQNDWHTLFSYYDVDGDNTISVSEFSTIIRRDLGMRDSQITAAEIQLVFNDIDKDGEGDVDAEEFAAWVVDESVEAQWVKMQDAVKEMGAGGLEERLKQSLRNRPSMASKDADPTASSENDSTIREAPWKRTLRGIIESRRFRLLVVGLVSANTAIIAMDHHNIDPRLDRHLHLANMALTIIFVLEMAVKILCYTRREFNATAGWKLDLLLAVGALADTVAFFGIDPNVIPMVDLNDIFIIARVLRPLRLVYTIPALQPVYSVSIKTLAGLVYILFLIGIFMFIFSVLGMQLFGGEFEQPGEEKPRAHYDSFAMAFTTTFQIMTFDSWQHVMYNGIRAGGGVASLYFVAWVVLGSMVMLNLLLVIIMEVYVSVKESFSDEALAAAMDDMIDIDDVLSPFGDVRDKDAFESEEEADGENKIGRSCGNFPIDHPFREFCVVVTHSKHLDHFVLVLIVANCISMAMDHPDIDPNSDIRWHLDVVDMTFTILFTLEMSLHIVAIGFYQGPHAYLKVGWNRIDFAIVVISWVDYLASALEIGFLRTLRLLRALRALRVFNRLRGLKVLIDSLLDSVSALSAIFAVAMIVFLGYAILGVSAFKGLFYRCNDRVGVSGVDACIGTFIEKGVVKDRAWTNAHNNFDNVGSAMFTLFTVSMSNDWIITAQLAIDAPTQVGQQPVREHSPWRIVYFMVFIVIVNFFFLNLFIGVIYGKYVDRAMEGMQELTKAQLQWLDVLRQLSHARPRKDVALIASERQARKFGLASNLSGLGFHVLDKTLDKAGNVAKETTGGHVALVDDALAKGLGAAGAAVGAAGAAVGAAGNLVDASAQAVLDLVPDFGLEGKAFDIVEHRLFDRFIISCIVMNCVMMACTYHNEPRALTEFFSLMNFVFTLIFTVEMCLKLLAYGAEIYFSDKWLRFDCFVVVGSWFDVLFSWFGIDAFSSSLFRIIRISRVIGRIGRAFKVLSDSKSTLGLDEVMECLYQALPQLAYIGILVGLILFIFAVLGMNLFGKLERNGCIGENSNFERAPRAVMTLLGVATKDRITCTIHATMIQEPFCSEADGTCGNPGLSQAFFICFSLVIMFTTLEMFVNVVLQSYEHLSNAAGLPITLAHIEQFEQVWKKYDPRATGWIALKDVNDFLLDLPPDIGFDEQAGEQKLESRYLRLVDLPDGHFSRYVLGETPEQVAQAMSEDGVIARIESISTYIFQHALVEMKDGLHTGSITSVEAGDNINGKPSFIVQSNLKKSAARPEGKIYTFLADTLEERDKWIATIKGTRGGDHYKRGELQKKSGIKGWKKRIMVARTGSLEWKSGGGNAQLMSTDASQSMDVSQSMDLSQQQIGEKKSNKRVTISKLQTRLANISGLTKAEVNSILAHPIFASTPAHSTDDEQVPVQHEDIENSNKKISRMKWEDGLLAFNEARRAAAGISAGDAQQSTFESMDSSLIDLDHDGTQAMLKLIMGQLNFYEMLYAVCERKTGKKLPADNFACREVRIRMGVRMPSIKERVINEVRRHAVQMTPSLLASMDAANATKQLEVDPWENVLGSKIVDDDDSDDDDVE